MGKVITRIAPSPTGSLHVGTARSALFNYLFARSQGGEFIVRIEDTDKVRSRPEYEAEILDSLSWLGIEFDKLYKQSEQQKRHGECIEQLIKGRKAFVSKEPAKTGEGEVELVRFKNPNKVVTFTDLIRGEISVDTTDLGDFAIARNLTDPLHHLAVVVDDYDEGVTHAIRGDDLLSNTPRQILIQEALGLTSPQYAHIPLILAPDRSKLSKRAGTATSVNEYRGEGFLPEALVNYLALLGWNPGTEKEKFTLKELVSSFDLKQIQKGGAVFDVEKLRWLNRMYLSDLTTEEMLEYIEPHFPQRIQSLKAYNKDTLTRMIPILKERISTASDIKDMCEAGEIDYYFSVPEYEPDLLVWKKSDASSTLEHLEKVIGILEKVDDITATSTKDAVWPYAEEKGRGDVLWPMRFALTGVDKSPDPFALAEVLGKEEVLKRLHNAANKLEKT